MRDPAGWPTSVDAIATTGIIILIKRARAISSPKRRKNLRDR
jgi:hypothetical protein